MSCRNRYAPGLRTLPTRYIFREFVWVTITVTLGSFRYFWRLLAITSESSVGVKSAAWISLINGRDILPSGFTVTSIVNSGLSQTEILMTSSHPIRYRLLSNKCSSFDRGESKGGGVCIPRFIAAISIPGAGGWVSSWVNVSSFAGNGRTVGGGV